jgi:hypothetical protein
VWGLGFGLGVRVGVTVRFRYTVRVRDMDRVRARDEPPLSYIPAPSVRYSNPFNMCEIVRERGGEGVNGREKRER